MRPEITPEQAKEWREREQSRLNDGTYTRLPSSWLIAHWYSDPATPEVFNPDIGYIRSPRFPDHFAHISIEKVAMVAFTENDAKGVADRQTRMSPGRYLTRFYSDWMTKDDIQRFATEMGAEFNDDVELKFAVTGDEIEHVYYGGPSSCMDGEHSFDCDGNPTRVYAGFDLQLAYLMREERITARALVWPEKKLYSRVYGDGVRLRKKLKDLDYKDGYESNAYGTFDGARITREKYDGLYVIPYLDGMDGAYDMGKHLALSHRDGKLRRTMRNQGKHLCCAGDCQNGLSKTRGMSCAECGERFYENDMLSNNNGDRYCQSCFYDSYGFCEHCKGTMPRDELSLVRVRKGRYSWVVETWCESARSDHAFFCDKDEVYYSDNLEAYEVDGETLGPAAFERECFTCEATGEHYYDEDKVTLADGTTWCQEYHQDHLEEAAELDKAFADRVPSPSGIDPQPVAITSEVLVVDQHHYIKHQPERDYPWALYRTFNGEEHRVNAWTNREVAMAAAPEYARNYSPNTAA